MGSNTYLYEKVCEAHNQDLRREAEKMCMLACLPWHRRSMSRHMAGTLGVLLLKLGMWLKQLEHSPSAYCSVKLHCTVGHSDDPCGQYRLNKENCSENWAKSSSF